MNHTNDNAKVASEREGQAGHDQADNATAREGHHHAHAAFTDQDWDAHLQHDLHDRAKASNTWIDDEPEAKKKRKKKE